jgi:hypothetical protein
MFTIGFGDSNRFLPREARQSAAPRRTPRGATFVQQFHCSWRILVDRTRYLRNTRSFIKDSAGEIVAGRGPSAIRYPRDSRGREP